MKTRLKNIYASDFETEVWSKEDIEKYGEQKSTEVWSAAFTKLYTWGRNEYRIEQSIRDFFNYFFTNKETNIVLYFHNLSFDGSFILSYLLKEGFVYTDCKKKREMRHKTFKCLISDKQTLWYTITIKYGHTVIEIRDSYKLLPYSLDKITTDLKVKHPKLSMDYYGRRRAYCDISDEEKAYIGNDVLGLREALELMFDRGLDKLTIGSNCMSEFKEDYKKIWDDLFSDLKSIEIDSSVYGVSNAWDYVYKSYSGAWCYCNDKYKGLVVGEGCVYDVNSLYSSVMHSKSGNRYPIGKPTFFNKFEIVSELPDDKYYFIRFKCSFDLKDNCFPWVHIRKNSNYKANECLKTSKLKIGDDYFDYIRTLDGTVHKSIVTMTMCKTDYILFCDTYNIRDFEFLDGCFFDTKIGIFDSYINYWYNLKQNATTPFERFLSKLYLNNLYGKFATSDDSSYLIPYLNEENILAFHTIEEHEKTVGYIPIGSAITAYAKNFNYRNAILNYDRFLYADTDSLHLLGLEDPIGVIEDSKELLCYKRESDFRKAKFVRQKTYAEEVTHENRKPVEKPYLNLKCAGMTKDAKKEFISKGVPIEALVEGYFIMENANIKAKRVEGGVILVNKDYKIRKSA